MDNNVSRNTISYGFFELPFTKENNFVSLKYLLSQELLQRLKLNRQQLNIELDLEFIKGILPGKITLFLAVDERSSLKTLEPEFFLKLPSPSIGYNCSIAFPLAARCSLTPQIIAENLGNLLISSIDNTISKSKLRLTVEIVEPGWIDFSFKPQALVAWLEAQIETAQILPPMLLKHRLEKTSDNLFPIQYIHARCCGCLSLAAREKLITLNSSNFGDRFWQIQQPLSISWGDEQHLWLTRATEYCLLQQLITVTDCFSEQGGNWSKLGLNLSQAVAVFIAECRFLGAVKQETPHIAIARLGLIALSQYWLQRILLEKLKLAAPVSL